MPPRRRCIRIQLIVIVYEEMRAELTIERRICSTKELPMLIKAITIEVVPEKMTALRGMSYGR